VQLRIYIYLIYESRPSWLGFKSGILFKS
jgi:hypothetical protein